MAIFEDSLQLCIEVMTEFWKTKEKLLTGPFHLMLHPPVYTCEQASNLCGIDHNDAKYPKSAEMKNLFLRDKKKNLFLISALVQTEIKLKDLKIGKGSLGFATEATP